MVRKFFSRERRLAQQERELTRIRAEVEELRARNASLRSAMRRCTTCDYRLMAKGQSAATTSGPKSTPAVSFKR